MWPLTLTHVTFDLEQYLQDGNMRPEITFLTWWPWPLTFKVDLWSLTRVTFYIDLTYYLNDGHMRPEIIFFYLVTLTYDPNIIGVMNVHVLTKIHDPKDIAPEIWILFF